MEKSLYINRCVDCGKYVENCLEQDFTYICYACVQAYKLKILNEANAVAAIRGNRKERRKQKKLRRKHYGTSTSQIKLREVRKGQDEDLISPEPENTGTENG